MRFGSFVFPVSHQPERDSAVIDNTLGETLLAEKLACIRSGSPSTTLTERRPTLIRWCSGQPLPPAPSAIRIGFAVAELAFHHPVRLAIQTSLLDNLSHGRLIVGTGRGSAYNHYEYLGFGITMEDGLARLEETEELLVAAWAGEDLHHQGEHWDVKFPLLRPAPTRNRIRR